MCAGGTLMAGWEVGGASRRAWRAASGVARIGTVGARCEATSSPRFGAWWSASGRDERALEKRAGKGRAQGGVKGQGG